MFTAKDAEEDTDALFSVKKINCASCTKDLGKYEGKLGQFRPWAIFPCKQMDPEKTGGYGFLNYLEKMSHKRGTDYVLEQEKYAQEQVDLAIKEKYN